MRHTLLINLAAGTSLLGASLYGMHPHENCGIFFDYEHVHETPESVQQLYKHCELFFIFARTHYVPEQVIQQLFPTSTTAQFIFLAHTLQDGVVRENQHKVMRIFLERNHLRRQRALHPATVQQDIEYLRPIIYALAYVFCQRSYPDNLPVKPLLTLFQERVRRHTTYYKLTHSTGLDDEQIDLLRFEALQAYDRIKL